jgi:hypothetical protein
MGQVPGVVVYMGGDRTLVGGTSGNYDIWPVTSGVEVGGGFNTSTQRSGNVPGCRGLVRGGNDERLGLVVSRVILGAAMIFRDNLGGHLPGGDLCGHKGGDGGKISSVRTYWSGWTSRMASGEYHQQPAWVV